MTTDVFCFKLQIFQHDGVIVWKLMLYTGFKKKKKILEILHA